MIPKYRSQFNKEFSQEKYNAIIKAISAEAGIEPSFRMSESPIFLTKEFRNKLIEVSDSIIDQLKVIPGEILQKAIPKNSFVPNDTSQPEFLVIDYGICKNAEGEVVPQLIELQAFPSLYAFQKVFEEIHCNMYPFLNELKPHGTFDDYLDDLRQTIVGNENPENVILLEIYPEKQKTNIDFIFTEKYLGIPTICLTKVKKKGRKLFYTKNEHDIEIKRIYNRVIFDELDKIPNLKTEFDFRDDVDVKWVTHPNWFFKVSKYLLPALDHKYIPKSYFVQDFPKTENLENYVLKPLFSFAGSGVDLHPTPEILDSLKNKENFILQKKVEYAPLFEDINGEYSKAEIRLLYLWKEKEAKPKLVANLVRMTKAAMVNVDFNKKDAIWIGSSYAFFEN